MTTLKRNSKRSASTSSPLVSTALPSINVHYGLVDCYNFLSPNEYSEKTVGLLAFLTRASVGEINFSDLIDEVEKHGQGGQAADFITSLEYRRDNLSDIEASIEKCLMINRLIKYIEENEEHFTSIITHIRLEMKVRMTDNQVNQTIQYPNDFRQREVDFSKRKSAQDIRRLFYLSHAGAKEPLNLIHLKNRTTEHLNYLLECKMRYEPKFRETGLKEFFKILNTSFMIITHPHSGVNPVIIYERKGPGEYTAKVSVTIVSLLHDFMKTHPNFIEFYDIEPSLWPLSPLYKLIEPRSISWKTCQLQRCPGDKVQFIHYAELSFITIQQTSVKDTRVHFAQLIHSLKFAIRFHVNLTEYHFAQTHQIILESLPFEIGQHNNQIPLLLTRVILDDIRRFSKSEVVDVKKILNFIQRYFIHRTGVKPHDYVSIYLEQELNKAKNERKNFQTLEDIYMDFLVPFVHQVEFMAKHPILAMFYADGLFLGICNSKRVAEVMMELSDNNSPRVGLRMNSIEIDYESIATSPVSGRSIRLKPCAVRVDIYNNHTKKIQNRTFNPSILCNDLSAFVSTAPSPSANAISIRILSNFDDKTASTTYKLFTEFNKYYHARLHKISKTDEKYKLLTNLMDNINSGNNEDIQNTDLNNLDLLNSDSMPSVSSIPIDQEHFNTEASFNQQRNQQLIQQILAQPELVTELLRQMTLLNMISPVSSPINIYQSNYTNQSPPSSMNGLINSSQQPSGQFPNFQTSEDNSLCQLTIDFIESIPTSQMQSITNDPDFQDLHLYLDDLTNDGSSFENIQ